MIDTTAGRASTALVRKPAPRPVRHRLGGVVLLLGALTVLVGIASGPGGRWVDRPPAPNSLAREAVRKLLRTGETMSGAGSRPFAASLARAPYIVIDTHTNRLYWRTGDSVLFQMFCSTGTGAELDDPASARSWRFDTPRGVFTVDAMAPEPLWRKPDWAFIEEGEPVPDSDAERIDPDALGGYSIGFGDGYFIHGTLYERLIGVAVTHGCVRLAADDLASLYRRVEIGTRVVIF